MDLSSAEEYRKVWTCLALREYSKVCKVWACLALKNRIEYIEYCKVWTCLALKKTVKGGPVWR